MEITDYGKSVEIKDGTSLEINFWIDGEIVISGIGYEFVIVVDSEDNSFVVLPSQLAKLF